MPSKKSLNIYFELGVFLVFVFISIFTYTAFITYTEVSANSEIIDTRNCHSKTVHFAQSSEFALITNLDLPMKGKAISAGQS